MRRHYRPFAKTIFTTLWGSAKIMGGQVRGTLTQNDVDDIIRPWAREIFKTGDATLTSEGEAQYQDAAQPPHGEGKPYVIMSNHQSLLDAPSIICTFPGRLRFISKAELGRLPLWGHAMRAAGVVFVERGDRSQSIAALDRAKERLREGTSIWMAPEGTRGPGDDLLPLKKGGFHLATQLGVPICPVWIHGTRKILSPDSFGVYKGGSVHVRYGAPIDTEGKDVPTLMATVREAMLSLRPPS